MTPARAPGIGVALALIAVYAIGVQLLSAALLVMLGQEWLWRGLLLTECLFLVWLLSYLRRFDRKTLGIRAVSWREGVIIVSWFLAIAFASDAVVLWLAPETMIESYLDAFRPVTPMDWLGLTGVAILSAPLLEEILFRGILLSSLRDRFSIHMTILGSTFLFALIHIKPLQVIAALPMGYILAAYIARGGSLYVTAVAHSLGNSFSLLGLVVPNIPWISADWRPDTLSGVASLLVGLALLVGFMRRYPP